MTIPQALQQLIDMVKNLAPQVWGIYLKQAFVYGITDLFAAVLFLGVTIFLSKISFKWTEEYKKKKNKDYGDDNGAAVFVAILAIFAFSAFLFFLVSSFGRLINPPYYAIQLMIDTATGR